MKLLINLYRNPYFIISFFISLIAIPLFPFMVTSNNFEILYFIGLLFLANIIMTALSLLIFIAYTGLVVQKYFNSISTEEFHDLCVKGVTVRTLMRHLKCSLSEAISLIEIMERSENFFYVWTSGKHEYNRYSEASKNHSICYKKLYYEVK